MKFDPKDIREKLGIGDDKVYGVIGEFGIRTIWSTLDARFARWATPSWTRCRRFRCTASTMRSGFRIRNWAGS